MSMKPARHPTADTAGAKPANLRVGLDGGKDQNEKCRGGRKAAKERPRV